MRMSRGRHFQAEGITGVMTLTQSAFGLSCVQKQQEFSGAEEQRMCAHVKVKTKKRKKERKDRFFSILYAAVKVHYYCVEKQNLLY